MKILIFLFVGITGPTFAFAKYCSYNGSVKSFCTSDYKNCMSHSKGMTGDVCKKESDTADLPPSLKTTDPKAFCLWFFHNGNFKNTGCMAQINCEYGMRQYPQTICAKGSLNDLSEIRKMYLAHEKKVQGEELAAKKKVAASENEIFAKGNVNEVIKLIEDKYGRLEITSPEAVADAQKRLEPFCTSGNPKACFALHDLFDLSDFKAKWNRSAEVQCNDLKKSYGFLYRSCELGYNEACQKVASKDDIYMERVSTSTFIRHPGQGDFVNPEYAKGVDCKFPEIPRAVSKMKEQCDDQGGNCIYKELSDVPLNKMTYDQLVADGEHAEAFKKMPLAISFYEKACEMKKSSHACLKLANIVYQTDGAKGRSIFSRTCAETKDKDVKTDCEIWARDFMPDPNSMPIEDSSADSASDDESDSAEAPQPPKRGKWIGKKRIGQ